MSDLSALDGLGSANGLIDRLVELYALATTGGISGGGTLNAIPLYTP